MSASAASRDLLNLDLDYDSPVLAALQLAVIALIRTHPDRDMFEEALSHGVDLCEERALRNARDGEAFAARSRKIAQTRRQLARYTGTPGPL